MLKIGLFYRDYTGPGGMPKEYKCLVKGFENLGHQTIIYCYGKEDKIIQESKGVTINQFKKSHRWLISLPFQFRSDLKNEDFDCFFVVSAHLPQNYIVSRYLLKNKIKYVYCVGGAYNPYLLNRKPLKVKIYKHLIELSILNNADIVRTYSNTNAEQVKNYGGKRPTFELLEGIYIENLPNSIPNYNFNNKNINVVYVGRIDYHGKGIDELLNCFKNTDLNKLNIKLNIFGPFASAQDEELFKNHLEDFTNDLVEYHGPVYGPEKFAVLKSCDLFIYPSRFEGIPRSIREALFFGTPVIVTNETNFADYIEKHKAGFVCDCDSISIYNALVQYLNNSEKEQLPINAKKLTDNFYNWDSVRLQSQVLLSRYIKKKN